MVQEAAAPQQETVYSPIAFDHFRVNDKIPCEIYTEDQNGKSLLVERNTVLTEPLLQSLMDARDLLFTRREDQKALHSFIEATLTKILEDDTIDPKEKSEIVHSAVTHSMKSFFHDPDKDNLIHAKAVVNSTTDLIINSDEATHTLFSLAGHDYYTYTHSCNVGIFGTGLAKAVMGGPGSFRARKLGEAFFFHDIGKVRVDSKIIQKPGRLSEEEWEEMQLHPAYGLEILEGFKLLTPEARDVVHQHHERPDGSGYPNRLSGAEIHTFARICTVVDVFDALSSERSYRARNSAFEACQIMLRDMRGAFDPRILTAFIRLIETAEGH